MTLCIIAAVAMAEHNWDDDDDFDDLDVEEIA